LAQLSQKQNDINIQISKFAAYESRVSTRVAKESLKSSADMQVIAAVTLGFLPGTFVATLFSASFWNFQPENKGSVVSKWVWLYWVVAAVLTLAVLVGWRVVSMLKKDGIGKLEVDLGKVLAIDNLGESDGKKTDEEKTV
jgi:Mg2+ and Co2+ transporter CorA